LITEELAEFIESGVSIQLGTRDARLVPDCVRLVGARVERGGGEVTVFLPRGTGAKSLANLKDNGRIAVCFSRPADHRSIQLKGRAVSLEDALPADRPIVDRYRAALADVLSVLGVPPRTLLRIGHWPCTAARFQVESVFVQTPGPGAGDRLRPSAQEKQDGTTGAKGGRP
jgi:hypothetical protein